MSVDSLQGPNLSQIVVGKYQLKGLSLDEKQFESNTPNFIFIPSALFNSEDFSLADVFEKIKLPLPQLRFCLNTFDDPKKWKNFSVADQHYKDLRKAVEKTISHVKSEAVKEKNYLARLEEILMEDERSKLQLNHYRRVLSENCRRLLHGTSIVCSEANAVFELYPESYPNDRNIAGEWLAESSIPMIGIAGPNTFHREIYEQLSRSTDRSEEKIEVIDVKIEWNSMQSNQSTWLPNFNLTHLLLSDDLAALKEKLNAIPTGLVLINGGKRTIKEFCQGILKGIPVFVFRHTGGAADLAGDLLDKVKDKMDAKRNKGRGKIEKPHEVALLQSNFMYHPVDKNWLWPFDDSLINCCIELNVLCENFPSSFIKESCVKVDIFNTSEEQLQDVLTKSMSVVFESVSEWNGGLAQDMKRLTYAWQLRQKLAYNAKYQKRLLDWFAFLVIFFTCAATLTSVVFVYLRLTLLRNPNGILADRVLTYCNLAFPLAVTILRGFVAVLNPQAKYQALSLGRVSIEREIYMFRTKVGPYARNKLQRAVVDAKGKSKSDDKAKSGGGRPSGFVPSSVSSAGSTAQPGRKIFSAAIEAVWTDLLAAISQDALHSPPDQNYLDDINKRISSNMGHQRHLRAARPTQPNRRGWSCLCPPISSKISPAKYDAGGGKESGGYTVETHLDKRMGEDVERGSSVVVVSPPSSGNPMDEDADWDGKEIGEDDNEGMFEDDGFKLLTADEYMTLRVLPFIAEFETRTPRLTLCQNTTQFLVIVLAVGSSLLGSTGYSVFIPAVFAISSAILAWGNEQKNDLKNSQINSALQQLHILLVWWSGLSIIERRNNRNKQFLVESAEMAIRTEAVVHAFLRTKKDADRADDGDIDGLPDMGPAKWG